MRGRLVAIHQYSAGGVNQGVPISAITQNLKSRRADLFYKVAYTFEQTGQPVQSVPRRVVASSTQDLTASQGKSVFVSYSHKDDRYRDELDKALVQLQRNGQISIWYDRKIQAGQKWDQEIDRNLETANIVLLLVSRDFLASDYASGREMRRALERNESGSATVVPIILRACDWQNSPLGELQALPKEGRPVLSWFNRDNAWLDVTQGLRRLISS